MDPLIRSASLDGMRRPLRPVAQDAPGAASPQAVDWRAECERLNAAMEELRRECDARLAERDAQLGLERAALARDATEREARALAEADERGHAEGLERGRDEGREALREPAARLAAAAATVTGAQAALLHEAEDGMVEVVFEAVCRMLGTDAALRASVMAAVAESRRRVERDLVLTVALHPDDLDVLRANGDASPNVHWVAADEPGIGGCVIESAQGALDARLDVQLEALGTALQAVRAARRAGERSGP